MARVRRWCSERVPEHVRDEVDVSCEVGDRHLTVVERRPPWRGDGEWTAMPVARLRYTASRQEWTLYAAMSDGRFRLYDLVPPARGIVPLLAEVERDPTGIFWG